MTVSREEKNRDEVREGRARRAGRGGGTPGPDRPRNEDDLTLSEMGSDWEGLKRSDLHFTRSVLAAWLRIDWVGWGEGH